jgi:hypothetical protein
MAAAHDEFRQLLETGNVDALRAAWARAMPGMPQPETREHAEIAMHMARTSSTLILFKYRAWSHAWLTERNLPSQLPDALRPRAERAYPGVVQAVGISVNFHSPLLAPAANEIRGAMEHAVLDAFAAGRRDPGFVTIRMQEARAKTERSLFGRR